MFYAHAMQQCVPCGAMRMNRAYIVHIFVLKYFVDLPQCNLLIVQQS